MTCWRLVGHVKVQTLDAREDSKIEKLMKGSDSNSLYFSIISFLLHSVFYICYILLYCSITETDVL